MDFIDKLSHMLLSVDIIEKKVIKLEIDCFTLMKEYDIVDDSILDQLLSHFNRRINENLTQLQNTTGLFYYKNKCFNFIIESETSNEIKDLLDSFLIDYKQYTDGNASVFNYAQYLSDHVFKNMILHTKLKQKIPDKSMVGSKQKI